MFSPKVECISTTQKYNIQFAVPFIVCVCIMIFEKIYLMFGTLPELFNGADTVYHIIANILSVVTQLSASVAAAIIFYYCAEFLNKKKDMEKYITMRRSLLITMYFMMDLLEKFEEFESIRCSKNKRMHDADDVERFYNIIKNINSNQICPSLESQLFGYIQTNIDEFSGYMRSFRSSVDELNNNSSSYRYFRNCLEDAQEIKSIFEELETAFIIYKDGVNVENTYEMINEELLLNEIVENFIFFVQRYTDFEIKLNAFMTSINRKQVITFMKLLD